MVKGQERPATRRAVESDETCPAAEAAAAAMMAPDSAPSSCESSPRNRAVGGRGGLPRSDSAGSQGPHTPSEESFYSSCGSSQESIAGLPFRLDDIGSRRQGGAGERAPAPRRLPAHHPRLRPEPRRARECLDPSDASQSLRPTDCDDDDDYDRDRDDFDVDYERLFSSKLGLGFKAHAGEASVAPAAAAAAEEGAAAVPTEAMSQISLSRYCQEQRDKMAGSDGSPVALVGSPDFVRPYDQQQHHHQQHQQHHQQHQQQQGYPQQQYQPPLYDHEYQQPPYPAQQHHQQQQQHCHQPPYPAHHQQQYSTHYSNRQHFSDSPPNSQPASPQHAPPVVVVGGGVGGGGGGGGYSRQSSIGLSKLEPPAPLVVDAEAGRAPAMWGCGDRIRQPGPAPAEAFSPYPPPACSPGGARTQSIVLPDRQRKIFVTYSLDNDAHINGVISFVTWLRKNGFYTELDIFDTLLQVMSKTEWMDRFLNDKDYLIVVIISPKYKRDTDTPSGSDEHGLHTHYIHQQIKNEYIQNGSKNFRLVPVLFPGATRAHVPSWLNNTIVYAWPQHSGDLMLRLCRREKYEIPPPGPLPVIVAQLLGSG